MPFLKNNGINIYYEIIGEGSPLFLINGLGGDTRFWQQSVKKLKSSFKIISYDMRCAGKSNKPDKQFSINDLADEAYALIQYLKIGKTYVLGFSMGGMVTMSLAIKYPKIFQKMFLVSTTPSLKRPYPPLEKAMTTFKRTDICDDLLSDVYEISFGSKFKNIVTARDFINLRMTDDDPQPTFAYLRQLEALTGCDFFDDVNKIKIPSVIIVGNEDKLIPPKNSVWLNNNLANSKLYNFEEVGHMLPIEAVEKFTEVLMSNK